jgi:hypothetical protein
MAADSELPRRLRARLRWKQACLAQAADLPTADEALCWALQIEVLRRLEAAEAAGDGARLRELRPMAQRVLDG